MELRLPVLCPGRIVRCDVRGFTRKPGDRIAPGDSLAEVRYELEDDPFTDCPVVQYGDLIARQAGIVAALPTQPRHQGEVLALVDDGEGEFAVEFVSF